MAPRYFNWKLAIVLVVAVVVFAAAAFALHQWQKGTRAEQALPLGEKAYAQQNWDEAATQLGRYLAINHDDVPVLLKYADAQLNKRPVTSPNLTQAIAAYRSVLRLERGNTEAARRLTEVYLGMATPGEAELVADRYLEEHEDAVIRRLRAVALREQRKFTEAATELRKIIETDPNHIPAYELLGLLAEQRPGDVNESAPFWFDEAIARNPGSALAYAARAGFHLRRGDRAKALADLEQAQQRDLSDTEVRLRLVRELISANVLDQARQHLAAVQAQSPTEQTLWRTWAELALRGGSAQEMQTVAETGLEELSAQPWDFMPIAAELLIRAGQFEKAQACISRLRQRDILPSATAFLEGLLAEKQGQFREAIAHWQRAISLGYQSPGAYLMLASAFNRLGDAQSAIGQLRTLVSKNPNHLDGHVALMRLLVQGRDWPAAAEEARRVQRIAPNHGEALLLEIQARMHVLAQSAGPADAQAKAWQEIEERLAALDKGSKGALQVKLLQAQVAMIQGKFAEAAATLQELENQHPSEVGVMLLLAELHASEGKEQEALARFRTAVEKFPQSFEAIRGLALFLNRADNQEECESVVKEALARVEQPPIRRDLGLLLADLYRRWGQQDKLYQWLSDLARQSPTDIQSKRQLLTCRQVIQNTQQAQAIVDEIKTVEGDKGWQWRYEQARIWIAAPNFKDRYASVVRLLQEILLSNPDEQASRLLLAVAYEKAGELQLALTTYREALARSPDNIPILIRTIAALYKADELAEAQEILDRAAQQGLYHPDLQKLQLQSHLRRGELVAASDILAEFIEDDPNDTSASLSLGLILTRQGKFDEAKVILDELQAKMPDSVSVIAARIQLSLQRGDTQEAIQRCDDAVKRLNNAFAYTLRAQTYVALKENDKALEDFGRAIALEPKRGDIRASRADFYRTLGRLDEAVADMRQALVVSPDSLPVRKRAISLLLASGEPALLQEAQVLIDKALAASPEDMQLRLFRARILLMKGTARATEEARRVLQEITDDHPKYAEAWEWMTRLELQQNEPGRAVDVALGGLAHNPDNRQLLLLKALAERERSPLLAALTLKGLADQYPKDVEVLIELADAYLRADRPEQALELLRQRAAGFEGPARRRVELALATTLYRNEQREDAKLLFRSLMQAEPDDPAPVMTLGQLLGKDKRWPEMNEVVTGWRSAHPEDVTTTTAIASALAGTGDKEALQMAEDLLRLTLKSSPKSVPSLMLLSMLMQSTGRDEESAALNRRILEIDPNNVIAINNLAWTLCERQGQHGTALKLAERGLQIAPDYMDLIDTRGMAHYRSGNLDQAVADFTRCLDMYPAHAPASVAPRFHLARTYARMGRKTQAVEQLKQALSRQEEIGGLSPGDLAEARLLLEQLQKGT